MGDRERQPDPRGTDVRLGLLLTLVDAGVISREEVDHIIDITNGDDTAEVIVETVMGELGKRGIDIERALETSQTPVDVEGLEPRKKAYSEVGEDIAGIGKWWLDWGTLPGQIHKVISGLDKLGFFDEDQSQHIMSEGATDEDAALFAEVQSVLDRSMNLNLLTEEEYGDFKTRLASASPQTIGDILQDIDAVGTVPDEMWEPVVEKTRDALNANPELRDPVDTSTAGSYDQYGPWTADMTATEMADQGLDPSAYSSWEAYQDTFLPAQNEFDPSTLRDPLSSQRLRSDIIGFDRGLVDPLTGAQLTDDQYFQIQMAPVEQQEAYAKLPEKGPAYIQNAARMAEGAWRRSQGLSTEGMPDMGPVYLAPGEIQIPTAVPDDPWEIPLYNWATGDVLRTLRDMSVEKRKQLSDTMVRQGVIPQKLADDLDASVPGWRTDPKSTTLMDAWSEVLGISRATQEDPWASVYTLGGHIKELEAAARSRGGSGRAAPKYSVPQSLREIPDYKTLAQNTKQIFRSELGRDMEDWELAIYSDALKEHNVTANEQGIVAHKAAWDDAVSGGTTDVEFIEVENPNLAVQYDIEEAYAAEIGRYERVEDRANSRRVMMDSIAVGERMI